MIQRGEEFADYVTTQTGFRFSAPHEAIGFVRDGKIRAAIVFAHYSGGDIELTVAGTEIPRSLLRAARRYVVEICGCARCTFKTSPDNRAAIAAMARLGARLEGQQRRYYGTSDALVYGILDEDFAYGR